MNYRVVITDTAKQDLKEIAIWIANGAKDTDVAKKFVSELNEKCKKLETLPNGGALPIPETRVIKDKEYAVTAIGDNAFKENTDITSVTMPNTVESLGNHTFYNCTKRIKMSLGGMSPLEYRRSLGIAI